jgi:hypothetical protein
MYAAKADSSQTTLQAFAVPQTDGRRQTQSFALLRGEIRNLVCAAQARTHNNDYIKTDIQHQPMVICFRRVNLSTV